VAALVSEQLDDFYQECWGEWAFWDAAGYAVGNLFDLGRHLPVIIGI